MLKSLAAALVGMAVFFSFFMMVSVPLLMIVSRLHHASDVVLAPTAWFRTVGLPLSAVTFVVCFLMAMKKFRRTGMSTNHSDSSGSNMVSEGHGFSRADQGRKKPGL
jgi:hypothetical protein